MTLEFQHVSHFCLEIRSLHVTFRVVSGSIDRESGMREELLFLDRTSARQKVYSPVAGDMWLDLSTGAEELNAARMSASSSSFFRKAGMALVALLAGIGGA